MKADGFLESQLVSGASADGVRRILNGGEPQFAATWLYPWGNERGQLTLRLFSGTQALNLLVEARKKAGENGNMQKGRTLLQMNACAIKNMPIAAT